MVSVFTAIVVSGAAAEYWWYSLDGFSIETDGTVVVLPVAESHWYSEDYDEYWPYEAALYIGPDESDMVEFRGSIFGGAGLTLDRRLHIFGSSQYRSL